MGGKGRPQGPQRHPEEYRLGAEDRSSPSGRVLSSAGEQQERRRTESLGLRLGGPREECGLCGAAVLGIIEGTQPSEGCDQSWASGPCSCYSLHLECSFFCSSPANSFSSFKFQVKSHFPQEACLMAHCLPSSDGGLRRIPYFSLLVLAVQLFT